MFDSWWSSGLLLFGLGGGLGLYLLYAFQHYMLYFPHPYESRTKFVHPKYVGLEDVFEEVFLKTEDGVKINTWLFKQASDASSRPTILFFHGNAGNISHRLPNIVRMYESWGCNVMILEYRGFGKSEGSPSQNGILLDAAAAVDYIRKDDDLKDTPILLFGRSLGGAVALHMAALNEHKDKIRAVIVENTFTNIPDMMNALFPKVMVSLIPPALITNPWITTNIIDKVSQPTLIISGKQDNLVPPWMAKTLFSKAMASPVRKSNSCVLLEMEGDHMDTWMDPNYFPAVKDWIDSVTSK